MSRLSEYKTALSSAKTETTNLKAKAETYRNTATDEIVSAVADDMQSLEAFIQSELSLTESQFSAQPPWYAEDRMKELKSKTQLYAEAVEYLGRRFDNTLKNGTATRCVRTIPNMGGVSLDRFNRFSVAAEKALQMIAEDMSRYKKIKTDLRAHSLIQEINGEIAKFKLALNAYNRSDLIQIYKNKDFRNSVDMYRKKIFEYLCTYLRIKRFENITDYY